MHFTVLSTGARQAVEKRKALRDVCQLDTETNTLLEEQESSLIETTSQTTS
jgi:hypothetical protein